MLFKKQSFTDNFFFVAICFCVSIMFCFNLDEIIKHAVHYSRTIFKGLAQIQLGPHIRTELFDKLHSPRVYSPEELCNITLFFFFFFSLINKRSALISYKYLLYFKSEQWVLLERTIWLSCKFIQKHFTCCSIGPWNTTTFSLVELLSFWW